MPRFVNRLIFFVQMHFVWDLEYCLGFAHFRFCPNWFLVATGQVAATYCVHAPDASGPLDAHGPSLSLGSVGTSPGQLRRLRRPRLRCTATTWSFTKGQVCTKRPVFRPSGHSKLSCLFVLKAYAPFQNQTKILEDGTKRCVGVFERIFNDS